jgi:ribose transport system permease protein
VAEFSGISVSAVRIVSYVVSAVCAAIGGIVIAGYVGTTYLTLGDTFLFSSITAVVIGGASILGGNGRYSGTVAGALTLTVLASLLTILNITEGYLEIIYGAVILGAVAVATNRS